MAILKTIPVDLLKQLFVYDAHGHLWWKPREGAYRWNSRNARKEAFTAISHGYYVGRLFGSNHFKHRILWALHTGEWPTGQLDHIDHNRLNNEMSNLREASQQDNLKNQSLRNDNTSGHCGVCWSANRGKWYARLGKGPGSFLGYFTDKGIAINTYEDFKVRRGYHHNHGTKYL